MNPSLSPLFPSPPRSVAVIADVHGNIRALAAVLDDIASQDVEAVVCNGDLVTSSAHTPEVVQLVRRLGIPSTRGNHERYLAEMENPADPRWGGANWAPSQFDFRALDAGERQWLETLPDTLWVCDGRSPLLLAHAIPGNDIGRMTAQSGDAAWEALFAGLPPGATLVGSHLHWFWQHHWRGYHFVRTPAVGLPLDADIRAGYVILRHDGEGWQVEVRRVAYDISAELAAFRASAFYAEGGVVARLFWEELRTARGWLMQFFDHLQQTAPNSIVYTPGFAVSAAIMEAAWRTFDRSRFPEYDPDAEGA